MITYLYYYCLLAILAAALTAGAVKFALRSSLRQFFIDRPDSRKLHQSPIPRMGGLCIIVSAMVVITFWNKVFLHSGLGVETLPFLALPIYYAVALSAVAIFCLGFFDDSSFARVRIRHKLAVEFGLATVIVLLFKIPWVHAMILSVPIPAWIVVPLSILWLVGLMNAFNIIDGVDGLAGGIAIISLVALCIFAAQLKETAVIGLCLVLAGGAAGFLVFNVSPARIFLGDTGSLFLGSMLGTLTLYCATISPRSFSRPVLFFLVAVPVIDVFVAIIRRYFRAQDRKLHFPARLHAIIIPDNNHIHHRLIMRGFSHSQTALVLCSFSALLCLGGLIAWYVPVWLKTAVLAYTSLCVVLFLVRLNFGARFTKTMKFLGRPASSKDTQQVSPAARSQQVGVIDPRGVIAHSLRETAQDGFVFVNLRKEDWPAVAEQCAALVLYLPPDASLKRDLALGQEAAAHGCPVIVVSEKAGLELTVSMPSSAPVCYRKMPVSILKIIEDLKEISREVPFPVRFDTPAYREPPSRRSIEASGNSTNEINL
jgi:UDP-GlcNAc:undecaprenyl-phosphate/decaprenyl-phosphate GlcNAc-1-phosphate transferase